MKFRRFSSEDVFGNKVLPNGCLSFQAIYTNIEDITFCIQLEIVVIVVFDVSLYGCTTTLKWTNKSILTTKRNLMKLQNLFHNETFIFYLKYTFGLQV